MSHAGVFRGGAVQACRMANIQVARGHRVTIIVNIDPAVDPEKSRKDFRTWRGRLDRRVKVYGRDLGPTGKRWKLRLLLVSRFPHVVHVHRDEALLAAAAALRRSRRVAFIAQRGTTKVPPRDALKVFTSPGVRGIVAVADAVREALIKEGVSAEKVRTIYGTVDLDEFAPGPRNEALREKLGLEPGDFVLGSFSSYRKDKGLEGIVQAVARLQREFPHLRLVFLGAKVEKKLSPIVDSLGILEAVRFANHQSNVADWMRAMDCTVMNATKREGLSGVLRESLACGIPVISTNSDGNGEIVRDGKTGLLIPCDDLDALTAAIRHAIENPSEMKRMAGEGRKWVEANCSPERHASELEAFYFDALALR